MNTMTVTANSTVTKFVPETKPNFSKEEKHAIWQKYFGKEDGFDKWYEANHANANS